MTIIIKKIFLKNFKKKNYIHLKICFKTNYKNKFILISILISIFFFFLEFLSNFINFFQFIYFYEFFESI